MPNRGQIADSSVLFHTASAYFTPTGAIFKSRGTVGDDGFAVYRLEFLGANRVRPEGVSPVPSSTNFYLGNDPSRWATGVPAYDQLVYRNLYDNIDLVFRADPSGLKYDLLVHPGGRLSEIRLGYQGAEARTDGTELVLATPAGTVREAPVMAYQQPGTVPLEARMTVKDNVVSYEVPHDPGRELVIDPLIYSTYIGGSDYDREPAMALDGSSNAYLAGQTESLDFPVTPGSYSGSKSSFSDAFILKLDKTGSALVYSTYVGGGGYDTGTTIALDSSGNAYVAGYTSSTDFPTTSGVFSNASSGGQDVFVLKLGPSGDELLCSTYVGGTGNDYAEALAIDRSGKAFVGGRTYSKDLPTTSSAYQKSYLGGNTDLFVLKLNAAMSALDYCTYLGGRWDDTLYSVTVDGSGNAYVTGSADSDNFPATTGAYDTTRDGDDAYALALDSSGGGLLFSSFFGGTGSESGRDISLDDSGNIYLAGSTYSRNLPTTEGALFRVSNDFNNGDAFVAKFDPDASDLLYSTYLGGKGNDEGRAVTPGKLGGITVLGRTASADFPVTEGCFDATFHDWTDAFLVRINATGASLDYSTFIGGSDGDYASSLALDSSGCMYAAGYTYSRDFPTTAGSFQTASAGGSDLFAFKMSLPPAPGTPQNLSALGLDGRVALSWARRSSTSIP